MTSSAFETAILTTALYGILVMVIIIFTTLNHFAFRKSTETRLGEIANHVAAEITSIYSACQQARGETKMFKPVEIPAYLFGSVPEYGYVVELKKQSETWIVEASLETDRLLSVSSPLWSASTAKVETGSGSFTVREYVINYSGAIHSGSVMTDEVPVVWARKFSNGTIVVGIGRGG